MFGKEEELIAKIDRMRDEQQESEKMLLHYFNEATNFQSVTELVRNYPNNQELGKHVRQLVHKLQEKQSNK